MRVLWYKESSHMSKCIFKNYQKLLGRKMLCNKPLTQYSCIFHWSSNAALPSEPSGFMVINSWHFHKVPLENVRNISSLKGCVFHHEFSLTQCK